VTKQRKPNFSNKPNEADEKQEKYSAQLKEHFDAVSNVPENCGTRKITVSKELYNAYIKLYFRSLQLAKKLECILNDGEHQLCMDEGQKDGWNLPDHDYMHDDVNHLKTVLKKLDPFRSIPIHNGSHVKISAHLAVEMHHLLQINILMSAKLFDMFRESEYLPFHRDLRERGIKYAGPTSLSEIVNTYMQSAHTYNKTQKYL
jgi:hypothetical protein